jgi:hypothetical protein
MGSSVGSGSEAEGVVWVEDDGPGVLLLDEEAVGNRPSIGSGV